LSLHAPAQREACMSIKEGSKSASDNLSRPKNIIERVWCPSCEKEAQLLRVSNAARLVDVNPRTIYRYIDEGLVYALKVAGKTYRVCRDCLLRQDPDSK
jgi:excisionase family DNA binding protein